MKKTNFDRYLDKQLENREFAERFGQSSAAWDVALQIAALRQRAGLSQKELAGKLRTSQQTVSRMESPSYEGHSLNTLRRVAEALDATLHISIAPKSKSKRAHATGR